MQWRPSASLEMLRWRARVLAQVRRFFERRGYWEVDTPMLSSERVVDPHLDPFVIAREPPLGDERDSRRKPAPLLYLHTSPEFAMKRLVAAGAEAIYQIGHVFRAGERGRLHNAEFTMVEWYRVGENHFDQMQLVEDLVVDVIHESHADGASASAGNAPASGPGGAAPIPLAPFLRTTYRAAFIQHAGIDVMERDARQLSEWARQRGLHPPPGLATDDRDGWLNWLLAELIEPQLGRERPEFLYDYPASQAALARIRPEKPPVAERFELYFHGIELCNGYHELGDADEIERRIDMESARRGRDGLPPLPQPARFLASMRAGLPDCTGVALGFDRLLLVAAGAETIDEVIPFPFERA